MQSSKKIKAGQIEVEPFDPATALIGTITPTNAEIETGQTVEEAFSNAQGQIDAIKDTTLNINGVEHDLSTNREWRTAMADTGCLTFDSPGITIASATQVNISAVTGFIVNNETNPAVPTYTYINYPGELNKTVTSIAGGQGSYILLGVGNIITFQNTFPTSAQRKTHIWLGKVAHPNLVSLTVSVNEPDFITSPQAFSRDLFQSLGTYINNGVFPYPNGANLTVNVTAGNIHGNGINFVNDKTNPDAIAVSGSPITFLPRTQTGAGGGSFISIVDVGNYDVGGVITAIPGANARSTIRYIYYIPSLGFIIQYGQEWYSNLANAIAAVGRESRVIYSTLPGNSILIGVLVARKDATQLNDLSQAQFFPASKIGEINGSTAGISTGTRQSTYNNSPTPQTLVSDALGADTWRNGRASDSSDVIKVQNIAGTDTFSVKGDGTIAGKIGTVVPVNTPIASNDTLNVLANKTQGQIDFTKWVVVNSNITAENSRFYVVIANATFTDPTPVDGLGYFVLIRKGIATIDSIGYSNYRIVYRFCMDGGFVTFDFPVILEANGTYKGIAKLYTALGVNTDGAVDQNTVNSALNLKPNKVTNTEYEQLADASDVYGMSLFSRIGSFFRSAFLRWNETNKQLIIEGTQAIQEVFEDVTDGNAGIKTIDDHVVSWKTFDNDGTFDSVGTRADGVRVKRFFTTIENHSSSSKFETTTVDIQAPATVGSYTLLEVIVPTDSFLTVWVDFGTNNSQEQCIFGRSQMTFRNDGGTVTDISVSAYKYDGQYSTITSAVVTSSVSRIDATISGTTVAIDFRNVATARLTNINAMIKHTVILKPV